MLKNAYTKGRQMGEQSGQEGARLRPRNSDDEVLAIAGPATALAEPASDWYKATGPLSPGATTYGSISPARDVDWYYFFSGGTGQVKLGLDSTSGSETALNLYRWDGGFLVYQSRISGDDLVDRLLQRDCTTSRPSPGGAVVV